jgi:gas vesicle protein
MMKASAQSDEDDDQKIRIGNVLFLNILQKMCKRKKISEFTAGDWNSIAKSVSHNAIDGGGSNYSAYIFGLYADSIEAAANLFSRKIPKKKADAIRKLAEELKKKTEQFRKGKITEPDYVEDSLWICLEAMMKMDLAYLSMAGGQSEADQLRESIAMYAFGYARLTLYQQEKDLLDAYEENRNAVNQELQEKYSQFEEELQKRTDEFITLTDHAFADDFRTRLRGSVKLAADAGVKDEDILHSVEEVDDFFLN